MFKMSARDAARFGQLFLQQGRWNRTQIVPARWVDLSTRPLSITSIFGTAYGLLWWVVEDFRGLPMFYAAGHSGQRICVLPSLNVVVVLNADSYSGNSVYDVDYVIPDLVFRARTGSEVLNPEFVPLEEPVTPPATTMSKDEQRRYAGVYTLGDKLITVSQTADGLILEGYHYAYKFRLFPQSRGVFHVEDIDLMLYFTPDSGGSGADLEIHKSEVTRELYRLITGPGTERESRGFSLYKDRLRNKEELEFLCDRLERSGVPALDLRRLNAARFPYSFKAQNDLKNSLLKSGTLTEARDVFQGLLEPLRTMPGTKTEWFADILDALAAERSITGKEADDLSGHYGYRHVDAEDGKLYYRTSFNPRMLHLRRMSDLNFAIDSTYNMYIEFGQDSTGAVNRIIGRYYRDSFDETFRTKE
jgi:hypothetical protein